MIFLIYHYNQSQRINVCRCSWLKYMYTGENHLKPILESGYLCVGIQLFFSSFQDDGISLALYCSFNYKNERGDANISIINVKIFSKMTGSLSLCVYIHFSCYIRKSFANISNINVKGFSKMTGFLSIFFLLYKKQ